ncbi:hypothetical protein E2C01_045420 [Portunus trituberculatus]|uniref:Uncharacterized protein n=1 Tax=Portunus trituberculatus TaxID=210409 RepID=A0A5B7FVQ7_PORTR|nr:hypothetical protein [Portunus trituberculatus]
MKSLLVLDKVAQDKNLSEVAREVGVLNGALALMGNANYKNNLVRHFTMKHKINHKYAHFCSSKVPVTCFLFDDDVSQSAKQIEVQVYSQEAHLYMTFHRDQNKRLLGFAFAQEFLQVPALWSAVAQG